MKEIIFGKKKISKESTPLIVAELSGNHKGEKSRALQLINLAKESGADVVKLQTYTADTMTIDSDKDDFLISEGPWKGYSLYKLYEEAHTPWSWHKDLFEEGRRIDLEVFSSPFDETAVSFLEDLGCPAYKIASFELLDLDLIECAASFKKPLIMSTGMANNDEIGSALETAKRFGSGEVVLLHCVSAYPTPPEDMNLRRIKELSDEFEVLTGLSDHTLGNTVSIAATVLGAVLIEKHFTFARAEGGVDAGFSMEPEELLELSNETKTAWAARQFSENETEKSNILFRRSIYVTEDIKQGEVFNKTNIKKIRPGKGLEPREYKSVIGRKAKKSVEKGTPLSWEMIEK